MKQNLIHRSHCTPPSCSTRIRLTLPQTQSLFGRNNTFSILITLAIDATFSQMILLETVPSPKPESQAGHALEAQRSRDHTPPLKSTPHVLAPPAAGASVSLGPQHLPALLSRMSPAIAGLVLI